MQLLRFFSYSIAFFRISCILPFFYPIFSSNFAPQSDEARIVGDGFANEVSSRVRDCSAPHLLLSPFEHSSLGAPTETHRTLIARSSRYHRTHIHE